MLAVDNSDLAENLCFEVVENGAHVVCFFAVADDGGEKSLRHLWVRPDRLRRGIGRLACEHVFALARKRRWPGLLVIPEPAAEGFYRRLAFEDTGLRVASRVPGGPTFSVLKRCFGVIGRRGRSPERLADHSGAVRVELFERGAQSSRTVALQVADDQLRHFVDERLAP